MKSYNYYTVKLNNQKFNNGITGGQINYSEVMCGDCLVPLKECSHKEEN